jgi:hypothetical protein
VYLACGAGTGISSPALGLLAVKLTIFTLSLSEIPQPLARRRNPGVSMSVCVANHTPLAYIAQDDKEGKRCSNDRTNFSPNFPVFPFVVLLMIGFTCP